MKYIENVVIGNIDTCESDLFAYDEKDWCQNEVDKTYYTNERFLPKILVALGIYPSVSEIRSRLPLQTSVFPTSAFATVTQSCS
jgi:hypothetical protein